MPLSLFFVLVVLAAAFWKRKTTSRALLVASFIWLLAVSSSPLPVVLTENLESRYEVLSAEDIMLPDKTVHFLVLGGGHTNDERLPSNNQLSLQALGRLAEGIRLQRQVPGSLLVTSGWSKSGKTTQAEVLARTALLLGMDSAILRKQAKPGNTSMEAAEYKRLYGDTARLVLITCATHMPRAMYLFRQSGLDPLAAPTNHKVKNNGRSIYRNWVPSATKIRMMENVVYEHAGMVYARLNNNDS